MAFTHHIITAVCGTGALLAGACNNVYPYPDAQPEPELALHSEDAGARPMEEFSFFVTSLRAMQQLSGSENGFGGDLRYGETGPDAGLRGADAICTEIAALSMPGSSQKAWRAFLSATASTHGERVDAVDRIGDGPWYDRIGRLVAASKADLLRDRPSAADPAIIEDLPNEDGVPNRDPDGQGLVDNHDVLTGSNAQGQLYSTTATCLDWTSTSRAAGKPRVGHAWPGATTQTSWISARDGAGCGAGSGEGYGALYCFALMP